MAIDLAAQGQQVLLLDNDDTVSIGSRGVCYAKRTLEVLDRLGCGAPAVQKGVSWNVGRTFFGDGEVFNFNLCPQEGHQRPGMVNLQQYYLEDYLVARARQLPNLEMRFKNNVISVEQDDAQATVRVETPDGAYTLTTDWLVAADGARSPIRTMLGLDIEGKIFMDRFLIADVVMKADYPAERWFWFDPPFHRNQSVLLHKQADNVWRIDFQLGWDADPEAEKKPENVIPRIQAMLGDDREFELEWVSVYTFQCRRMGRFNHNRVLFVGDAAHQVSPFGARGGQQRHSRHRQPGLEAQTGAGRQSPRFAAGQLQRRALLRRRREHHELDALDRLHHAPRATPAKPFATPVLELAQDYPFARALVELRAACRCPAGWWIRR